MIIELNGVISYLSVKTNWNKTVDFSSKIPPSFNNINVILYCQKRQQFNPRIEMDTTEYRFPIPQKHEVDYHPGLSVKRIARAMFELQRLRLQEHW